MRPWKQSNLALQWPQIIKTTPVNSLTLFQHILTYKLNLYLVKSRPELLIGHFLEFFQQLRLEGSFDLFDLRFPLQFARYKKCFNQLTSHKLARRIDD